MLFFRQLLLLLVVRRRELLCLRLIPFELQRKPLSSNGECCIKGLMVWAHSRRALREEAQASRECKVRRRSWVVVGCDVYFKSLCKRSERDSDSSYKEGIEKGVINVFSVRQSLNSSVSVYSRQNLFTFHFKTRSGGWK